jgi:hypothetical protein
MLLQKHCRMTDYRPHEDVETSTSVKLASRLKDEETKHEKRRIPTTDLPKRRTPQSRLLDRSEAHRT